MAAPSARVGADADHALAAVVAGQQADQSARGVLEALDHVFDDLELAAVITYERNAWGNNTGDVVQPTDVKAAR